MNYKNLSQEKIESYFGDVDPIEYYQGKSAEEIETDLIEIHGTDDAEEIHEIANAVYKEINQ